MLEHEISLLNVHDDSSEDEKLVKAKRRNQLRDRKEEEVEEVSAGEEKGAKKVYKGKPHIL